MSRLFLSQLSLFQPSLFKRLMFSVLALSFALWCVVLFLMIYELKKIPARFEGIYLESIAQQQLIALKAIPSDEAISRYAGENDVLLKKLDRQLSIFVSQYHLQVWRGDKLIYSFKDLPTTKPALTDRHHLGAMKATSKKDTWLAWSEYDSGTDITVRVVQEPVIGFSLSVRTFGFYLIPFTISVPFLFFPIWWAISRGLRPLNQVAAEVVARTDMDLSPIKNTPYLELAPIVNAINRLMERVNARIQREQEFLHDAAHELKTPLAVIQLNSEILATAPDEPTKNMALTGIQNGVTRATHTTHQLLASARSENHLYSKEVNTVINFTTLLQDRLAYWMSFALQKNIEIELDAPLACELNVDVESVTLLIDNLIDNAIKYSDSTSIIRVSVIDEAKAIIFKVSDQGCGIPEGYREKVFERFYRMNQSESHGTGLGLSIVKRAAQQHGATIELASNVEAGHGLVVTILFQKG